MSKERINVTVDPDIKRQIKKRDDINVSGAVNDYLKRRLMGEVKDDAVLEIEIENHEEQAKKLHEKAERHERRAQEKRRQLRERKEERAKKLKEVASEIRISEMKSTGPYITDSKERVAELATQADVDPDTLRETALEQYHQDENENQRHYQ